MTKSQDEEEDDQGGRRDGDLSAPTHGQKALGTERAVAITRSAAFSILRIHLGDALNIVEALDEQRNTASQCQDLDI